MKSAVCLSGQLRWVEYCYPYIYENLIKPNNADVFLHAWYSEDDVGTNFTDFNINHTAYKGVLQKNSNINAIKLYKPKSYLFEKQFNFVKQIQDIEIHPKYGSRPLNVFSMFYSIMQSNNMKNVFSQQNNINYDFVARCRFDLIIQNQIYFNDYDINKLHIKGDCKHTSLCLNDHFAFSNSKNMDMYCETYNNIRELYFINKINFCPEILLGHSLYDKYNLSNIIQKHYWNNRVKYVY